MEQLRANDETPVDFLMHDEAEAKKYVSTLVKIMKTTTSDARAQHFAVSRWEGRRVMAALPLVGVVAAVVVMV